MGITFHHIYIVNKFLKQIMAKFGVELIQPNPSAEPKFPYLSLREPQQWLEQSEITLHRGPGSSTGTFGIQHPSVHDASKLVDVIDGFFSDREEHPRVLRVVVYDSAWKETAEMFRDRHNDELGIIRAKI